MEEFEEKKAANTKWLKQEA